MPTVTRKVVDTNGNPIAEALLTIVKDDVEYSGYSVDSGFVNIDFIGGEIDRWKCSKEGYKTASGSGSPPMDIVLTVGVNGDGDGVEHSKVSAALLIVALLFLVWLAVELGRRH